MSEPILIQLASALHYIGYRGDILSFEPIPGCLRRARSQDAERRTLARGRQSGDISDHIGEDTLNIIDETVYSLFRSRLSP